MASKVVWGKGQLQEFILWLTQEITNTLSDRNELERKWSDYLLDYSARHSDATVDFPWPGAPNEILPLVGMHVDPVLADFLQSVHAPANLWTALPLGPDWTDLANPVTEFMQLLERNFLRLRKVNERAFLDMTVLGTCIYKHGWLFERVRTKDYNEQQEVTDVIRIRDNPIVEHIPLQDFMLPANAWDIDPDAPVAPARWVGHRFKLTRSQLKARAKGQEPYLPNYDSAAVSRVALMDEQEQTQVESTIREVEKVQPFQDYKIELFEIWARFDVDGDGIDEDIVVVFSHKGREVLRATHNPFLHGKRPYEAARYMPSFGFYGAGIAQLDEWAQITGSMLLNALLANVLVANTRMYGIPQGAMVRPDEPIYPGKIWPLGPNEAVGEVKMGEIYPSLPATLQMVQQLSELRTGVPELRTGNVSGLPSRTPATTILSLLREGNKRFDMIMGNLRTGALANIGKRTFQNVAQRAKVDQKWALLAKNALGPEDGAMVERALSLPLQDIEEGLGIEVTATSGLVNKEIEKQNLAGLFQILQGAYGGMFQVAQLVDPDGQQGIVQELARATLSGGTELMKRMLEAYDWQNPEKMLPKFKFGGNGQQQGGIDPNLLMQLFSQRMA